MEPSVAGNQPSAIPTKAEDAAARHQATDPAHSYILQAPAGSGKTSVLVQRFLAVLATVARPEHVLAITFTRKAAGEMQARIFEALKLAEGAPPAEDFRKRTYDLARAVLERSGRLGWNLLSHPARLNIYTIDALCRKIVGASPLSSGMGLPPEVSDNTEPLLLEALDLVCVRMGGVQGEAGHKDSRQQEEAFAAILRHVGGNLGRMKVLLLEMLKTRDRWALDLETLRSRPTEEERRRAMDSLVSRMAEALQRIVKSEMELALTLLKEVGVTELFPIPEALALLLPAEPEAESLWKRGQIRQIRPADFDSDSNSEIGCLDAVRYVADWLLTGNITDPPDKRKVRSTRAIHFMGFPALNKGGDKEPFVTIRNQWSTILSRLDETEDGASVLVAAAALPDPNLDANQRTVLESMILVLGAVSDSLQQVFARKNLCDFTEFSLRAIRALGEPWELTEVAERFDASYHHILIDEFQDTSHSQVALLASLTKNWDESEPGEPAGRTLFLVGDPMQSIYLFRQADVSLFLQAWNSRRLNSVPLEPLSLSVNFRSEAGIVDFVNLAFESILPERDDLVTGEVTRRSALAHRAAGKGPAIVTNLSRIPDRSGERTALPHNSELQLTMPETRFVVAEVRRALDEAADSTSQEGEVRSPVAILVRARSHATGLLAALRAEGIGITAIELDKLVHRSHVRDLVQLTSALAHPGNRLAWTALLHSPAIGLTYADLARLAGTVSDGDLPVAPTTAHPEGGPPQPASPNRTGCRAIRMALPHLIFHDHRRQHLSGDGKRRLERVLPLLERAMDQWQRRPARTLVEGLWISLGFPGCYPDTPLENLMQDVDLVLDTIHAMEREGESFLGSALQTRLKNCKAPVPLESRERVTVCTIHAAKGLEWETVILPGINSVGKRATTPLITYESITLGEEVFPLICPMTARDSNMPNSLGKFLASLKARRLAAELRRLLYVGTTRARKRLVMTASKPKVSQNSFLELLAGLDELAPERQPGQAVPEGLGHTPEKPHPDGVLPSRDHPVPVAPTVGALSLLALGLNPQTNKPPAKLPSTEVIFHSERVLDAIDDFGTACCDWITRRRDQWMNLRADPRLRLRHVSGDWTPPEMPVRVRIPNLLPRPDKSLRTMVTDIRRTVLSGQVLIPGQAFHRVMHALARRGPGAEVPRASDPNWARTLEVMVERALAMEGIGPEGAGDGPRAFPYHGRLRKVLARALMDPALRWTLSIPGESEVGVEGMQNGEYTVGRVDRTFVNPQTGVRYIVDYKVVSHEGGGLETFLTDRAAGYAPQLERYARLVPALAAPGGPAPSAVRLALFFAAQSRWFVWQPGQEPQLIPEGAETF